MSDVALLQISEPGASPDPHQRRLVVGIDLGTTHSLVAAVRSGVAECLPDLEGRVLLPSVVRYLAGNERRIGHAALADAASDPRNTIASVKRLMGRGVADMAHGANLKYDFVDEPGMVRLKTIAGIKSPIEVSAEILATLRQRAEDTLGDDLFGAVITVPAYFDDAQRQATKDAARLAGVHVLRLISEPTAAAVAYGLDNRSEGLFAVYDLGGGTFDISILRLTRGVFEVIATGGDSALGGDDFDAVLAQWAMQRSGYDAKDARDQRALQIAARVAKEALSNANSTLLVCALSAGDVSLSVTRADFEALAAPFVERTLRAARQAMRDAGVERSELDGVILVGGATRMPVVRDKVAAEFAREPLTNLDPDRVVAIGAAIQAEALAGNAGASQVLLLDVIPLSLGLETMGGLVERIIPRNSAIPTARAQDFTTYMDGQTAIAIHVVQGERELVADCRSLARFDLRGIPPMVAGAARVRVSFEVDADGLLNVVAREEASMVEASISVKPTYGLADDDIARMLSESFSTADADMQARANREAKVDADRLALATQSALTADGDLLDATERAIIDACLVEIAALTHGPDMDRNALEQVTRRLSAATESFAGERMNRGIRRALAGRRLEDI